MPPETDAMSIIVAAFEPIPGRRILDVGCGRGVLARSLSERGARVVGVDPNPEALEAARKAAPAAEFYPAGAEALPFTDGSFDGAVFLNSLHHVPGPRVRRALEEAARVVGAARSLVVIEPLAEGPFFSALRTVEDEAEIRAAAQEAIELALAEGAFEQLGRVDYLRRERFRDPDQFLARIVAADPARAVAVREHRSEVESALRHHARPAEGGILLDQPMRARVLAVSSLGSC